jgi:hypothetical protein
MRAHESVHGRPLYDSPHKQGHGHSPKVSQTQKNIAESSNPRTRSPICSPSPSHVISPLRTFFDRFSPLGHVYFAKRPSYLSLPSASMPICRSTHSRDAAVRARGKHVETGTWKRQCQHPSPTSRVRGHVFHSMAPHVSTACIYSLSTYPALVLSACSAAAPLAILPARLAYLPGRGCVAA